MRLKSLRLFPENKLYAKAWELYEASFPREERRDFAAQLRAHSFEEYEFRAWLCGEEFLGFTATWAWKDWLFLDHFAVKPERRNRGVGRAILNELLKNKLVLEIEPPEDEISQRRLDFYLRNGMKICPWKYVSRGYISLDEEIEFIFLSSSEVVEKEKFDQFKQFHDEIVMGKTINLS